MILCIDSGNTRIKWGLRDGERWLSEGALLQAEIGELGERLKELPAPDRIMVANVAGAKAAAAINKAFSGWLRRLRFVQSAAEGGGVVNGYGEPASLGVDRWCALVGARQRVDTDCLVVGAGTATTIDALSADGHFLGGLILPGFDLMRQSLARHTAGLPLARGRHEAFPRCTDDAIFSGCLEAQVGAIGRAFARIAAHPGALCLLFGGAAPLLAQHLDLPFRQADTLVLDGLFHLAGDDPG
ncbi:MAG: type pantothenate kinase [Rhodocyclaceae bacterium]|nr:type pantothenate kinase [Rhodocyclaceae bacterium]